MANLLPWKLLENSVDFHIKLFPQLSDRIEMQFINRAYVFFHFDGDFFWAQAALIPVIDHLASIGRQLKIGIDNIDSYSQTGDAAVVPGYGENAILV